MPDLFRSIVSILDKFIPDKGKRISLAHELSTMADKHAHEVAMAQIELTRTEAQHRSIFVAGWRPFCGWLCVFALGVHFILFPVIMFIANTTGATIALPEFEMSSLMTVLLGMLGLGTLRTYEKQKGLTK